MSLVALGASLAARPRRPAPFGDATRGHALAYTCNGCHAIPNYKNVYPTYSVPKLHGQRARIPGRGAQGIQERRALARHHAFAGQQHERAGHGGHRRLPRRPERADAVEERRAGHRAPKASEVCLACHGTNGVGITADYPTIAGQHKDYIERALHDYQKGGRKNPIMARHGGRRSPRRTSKQLATYYSSQTPALETVPKKSFFFSSSRSARKRYFAASCFSRKVTIVFW